MRDCLSTTANNITTTDFSTSTFTPLLEARTANKIDEAKNSGRKGNRVALPPPEVGHNELSANEAASLAKSDIIRELHRILSDDNSYQKAPGTGLARSVRWKQEAGKPPAAGNAANAAFKSRNDASKVCSSDKIGSAIGRLMSAVPRMQVKKQRTKVFKSLECGDLLVDAGLSALNLLQMGSFGIIVSNLAFQGNSRGTAEPALRLGKGESFRLEIAYVLIQHV